MWPITSRIAGLVGNQAALSPGGLVLPSFPGASAVQRVVSPNWGNSGGVTITTGQADPLGGTEAVSVVAISTGSTSGNSTGLSGAAAGVVGSYVNSNTYTLSFYAKHIAGVGWIRVGVYDTGAGDAGCHFNVSSGIVGSFRAGGVTESNAGVNSVGDGWYQFYFSYQMSTTSAPGNHDIAVRGADNTDFDASSSVTAGDGFYIWRYQIVNGTNPNG